jgi:aspartate/methionine/tyrosine aminotransferase
VPAYESNGFVVEPEDIRLSISDKTKLIILNTPANPTGAVLDKTVLEVIANIAREYDLWVLADESLEHIVFDGKKHLSIGSFDGMKDRTISVYSIFRSHAMTGWKAGYVVAPKTVIDEIENLSEQMGFGVAAVVQHVARAVITAQQDLISERMKAYEKCRAIVHQGLNSIPGVSCLLPASTLYAFPNFSKLGLTSWNLSRHLLREHKVALLPGSIFGNNGEGYLRLSYAVYPSVLIEAISCIKKGAGQLLSY